MKGMKGMAWWEAGLRLLLAVVVGCVIGIERERKNRPAGMRTHVLVCVGAALISVMETYMIADALRLNLLHANTGVTITMGRISAQVVSGIGFLGAGTIFISQKKIAGLTTAASLWNAACLGLAAGMGYYGIAIAGCAIVMITLTILQRVVKVNAVKNVEVKFIHRVETIAFINDYFQNMGILILDIDFHVENMGKYNLYTNLYTLDMQGKATYKDIVNHLSEYANIQGIRTRNT
jgi:putative Mg2+ transporter-C (MgtC) family protein